MQVFYSYKYKLITLVSLYLNTVLHDDYFWKFERLYCL